MLVLFYSFSCERYTCCKWLLQIILFLRWSRRIPDVNENSCPWFVVQLMIQVKHYSNDGGTKAALSYETSDSDSFHASDTNYSGSHHPNPMGDSSNSNPFEFQSAGNAYSNSASDWRSNFPRLTQQQPSEDNRHLVPNVGTKPLPENIRDHKIRRDNHQQPVEMIPIQQGNSQYKHTIFNIVHTPMLLCRCNRVPLLIWVPIIVFFPLTLSFHFLS